MSESRSLGRSASREGDESLAGGRRQSKVKYVYRLLRRGDVAESLVGKTVFVLWPDDGTWYKGRIKKCDVADAKAIIYYAETEETEEADLQDLVKDGQIAFKEPRPSMHKCKPGEIELDQRYFGRQPGEAELEDSDPGGSGGGGGGGVVASDSDDDEVADAGALDDGSDSDVSFDSAELRGRKRRRGGADSDEEVELEEFERKEIMRDMSDDEKPLGWRAEEMESKPKKRQQSGTAAKPAAAATKKAQPPKAGSAAQQQRRRREAAAGVAAAVHAVAAVQAAVAADGSSDEEEPRSSRKPRVQARKAAAAEDDEEAEAEAYAQSLLARVTGGKALPGQREAGAFYGRQGSGSRELERRVSSGQSDEELRQKVRGGLQQALELVAGEAGGEASGLQDPSAVAESVEASLHALFGGITKDYKQKFRTLQFNLKDPHNPDLRAHVLRGDIPPDAFVRMTATELANKELAAYRKAKEEEALKMSVLDAEAAARFSTAAALDARDRLSIPASMMADKGMLAAREPSPERERPPKSSPPPTAPAVAEEGAAGGPSPAGSPLAPQEPTQLGSAPSGPLGQVGAGVDRSGQGGYRVSDSAELAAGQEEYDPEAALADEGKAAAGPAAAAAPTLDWAAIRAAAAEDRQGGGGQPLLQLDGEHATRQAKHSHSQQHQQHRMEHTSPLELPSPHEQLGADEPLTSPSDPESPRSLRPLLLPPVDPSCLFGKAVWEGQFVVPGVGAFQLAADALAGSGDVAALLGEQELEVKGRLALDKLDHFLGELRHSRSRTVTLGLLSPAADCQPAEVEALQELVGQYEGRRRTGVAAPARDVEAYLLPACPLSGRLLSAARGVAGSRLAELLPGGELGPGQLLIAIIHRKDWRPSPGVVRPVKRRRVHPAPGAAEPAAAPGGGSASALPPIPQLPLQQQPDQQQQAAPQPVALPVGLDLDAISALAAALGVAPAGPQQQQAPPASPLGGPPDGAAAPPPPPPAAPALPADQLQQLLASLPPAAGPAGPAGVPHTAGQPAEPAGRRSRWEGSHSQPEPGQQQAPSPPPQSEQQASGKRRSRWEAGEDGAEQRQQAAHPGSSGPAARDAGPSASGAPPPPGPMGPMQRVPMQRAAQLQQGGGSAAQPPGPGPAQPPFGMQASQAPFQPPLGGPDAPPPPFGVPPPPPFHGQGGSAPPSHTGGYAASGAPPNMMGPPQQPHVAHMGGGGHPPGGFGPPGSAPMHSPGQQYGGRAPRPRFEGGRGGRFGGRGRGWTGRDDGRGRGGRGGRGPY